MPSYQTEFKKIEKNLSSSDVTESINSSNIYVVVALILLIILILYFYKPSIILDPAPYDQKGKINTQKFIIWTLIFSIIPVGLYFAYPAV